MEICLLKMKLNKNKIILSYIKLYLENNSKYALIHTTND